ncbi:hypothetical protein EVJ32_10520 [Exiguobacterium sp. SH5S4]|uniref:N-6 DNA methylase n=1 Tax=Exiguobacterium sp. SH5S4 TaxID=2510961 RepID=UPI001040AAF4|nr:N-6 DNA methylase [Exiguobacterium sp. SH5S4]TCI25386.1 hypothetical protein EVJ32_10520 [Exiguobacterium sp. SH5S4]
MEHSLYKSINRLVVDGKNIPPSLVLAVYSIKYLSVNRENQVPNKVKLDYLIKDSSNTIKNLRNAFQLIEETFPALKGVYTSLKISWSQLDERVLFEILVAINKLEDIDYSETVNQIKHSTYGGRSSVGAEHTTPEFLNRLLVKLLDINENSSFYDGVAGYGGTIIEASKQNPDKALKLYGQELNSESWAIGKLALLLSDISIDTFALGNTLSEPWFVENNETKKFDYIAMAIPFSHKLQERDYAKLNDDPYRRFVLGKITKSNADMAFIQHAISSSSGKGRVILIVTNGTLFRGGVDQEIRQRLLDTDQIEAVISLSDNLLHNTAIPISLLILNKNKPQEKAGKVQFINASKLFEKKGTSKYLIDDHIARIHKALNSTANIEYFSKLVPTNELQSSLAVERYLRDKQISLEGNVYRIDFEKFQDESLSKQSIHSLGTVFRGINISTKNISDDEHGIYKIIKMSDVQDGKILFNGMTTVTLSSSSKADQYQVQEGDLIISSRGQNIKIAVVPAHKGTILLSQNFLGFRPHEDKIDPYYLQTYLESPVGQYSIQNIMGGALTPVLNPKDLSNLEIIAPSLSVQKSTAAKYKEAKETYEHMLKQALQNYTTLKNEAYSACGIIDTFEKIE